MKRAIATFAGVKLVENPYPTAVDCIGSFDTLVGRVRLDPALPGTVHFWVVSDNLLKGAAWNAVQIAEFLLERGHLGQK